MRTKYCTRVIEPIKNFMLAMIKGPKVFDAREQCPRCGEGCDLAKPEWWMDDPEAMRSCENCHIVFFSLLSLKGKRIAKESQKN